MIRHILCVAVGGDIVSHLETGGRLLVQSFTRDPLEIFEGTRYVTVLGARFLVGLGFRVSDLAEQFASGPCDCRIFFGSGLLGHLAQKQPAVLITPLTRKSALRQTSESRLIWPSWCTDYFG